VSDCEDVYAVKPGMKDGLKEIEKMKREMIEKK